jgi:hypothetical protein
MQVVIVRYPTTRRVFIDSQAQGMTHEEHILDEGFHRFDLGLPDDYAPAFQEINVIGGPDPMNVDFFPLAVDVGVAPPQRRRAARPKRGAKKAKGKKAKGKAKKKGPRKRAKPPARKPVRRKTSRSAKKKVR